MHETIQFVTFAGGSDYVRMAETLTQSLHTFCRFPITVTQLLIDTVRPVSSLHKPAIILAHQNKLKSPFLYFIDADMEAVAPIHLEDLLPEPEQSVSAVEHFFFSGNQCQPKDPTRTCFTPPDMRGPHYWQACLFGGRTEQLLQLLHQVAHLIWTDHYDERATDEPYVNFVFNQQKHCVRTLPCIFASPVNFPWRSAYREMYERRSAGRSPIIKHYNFGTPQNRKMD